MKRRSNIETIFKWFNFLICITRCLIYLSVIPMCDEFAVMVEVQNIMYFEFRFKNNFFLAFSSLSSAKRIRVKTGWFSWWLWSCSSRQWPGLHTFIYFLTIIFNDCVWNSLNPHHFLVFLTKNSKFFWGLLLKVMLITEELNLLW